MKSGSSSDIGPQRVDEEIERLFEHPRSHVWPRGLLYNFKASKLFLSRLRDFAPTAGRFLDLGCGPFARHRPYIEAHGLEWYGTDFMALDNDSANYRQSGAGEIGFEDGVFDVVGAYNVIEHFDDPEAMFAEISRVLKPGGHLCGGCAFGEVEHHSYFHLSIRGLEAILKRHGFELVFSAPSSYTGAILVAQRYFGGNGRIETRSKRRALAVIRCNLNWLPFLVVNLLEITRRHLLGEKASLYQNCATIFFYARKRSAPRLADS